MNLIFNELSSRYTARNQIEANEWMQAFFSVTETLSKRIHKRIYIRTTTLLSAIFIAYNYTFGQWLHTLSDKDYQRKIINIVTNQPLLDSIAYYYYLADECVGLGIAFEQENFSISYPIVQWARILEIRKEYMNEIEEIKVERRNIFNLTSENDVYSFFPKRNFQHHWKHDNRRLNLNDGQSTLYYNIPEEIGYVQKLLECSFGSGKLFSLDSDKGLYIEFQCHGDDNYHAYHIHNENRVPNKVKRQIEEFYSVE